MRDNRWLILATILALAALVIAAHAVRTAHGHSWYDAACCAEDDCWPVDDDNLAEIDGGWRYVPTGNEFRGTMVRPTRDRRQHVCIGSKGWNWGRSYCVYVRMGS
jgi:hypothetical protein